MHVASLVCFCIIILLCPNFSFQVDYTIDDFVMRNAQGTYWCKGCGHHSSSRRDLSRHIEAKHMGGEYPCKFCEKILTTKYNVQRHLNKCHREEAQRIKQEMEMMAWTLQQQQKKQQGARDDDKE
jgi:uncharacterized C2H2 Zn-finger protein